MPAEGLAMYSNRIRLLNNYALLRNSTKFFNEGGIGRSTIFVNICVQCSDILSEPRPFRQRQTPRSAEAKTK